MKNWTILRANKLNQIIKKNNNLIGDHENLLKKAEKQTVFFRISFLFFDIKWINEFLRNKRNYKKIKKSKNLGTIYWLLLHCLNSTKDFLAIIEKIPCSLLLIIQKIIFLSMNHTNKWIGKAKKNMYLKLEFSFIFEKKFNLFLLICVWVLKGIFEGNGKQSGTFGLHQFLLWFQNRWRRCSPMKISLRSFILPRKLCSDFSYFFLEWKNHFISAVCSSIRLSYSGLFIGEKIIIPLGDWKASLWGELKILCWRFAGFNKRHSLFCLGWYCCRIEWRSVENQWEWCWFGISCKFWRTGHVLCSEESNSIVKGCQGGIAWIQAAAPYYSCPGLHC